jgi:LAO/AO transport system kinase
MDYVVLTKSNGHFHKKRNEQNLRILSETINSSLTEMFYSNEKVVENLEKFKTDIIEDKISAYIAAQKLIEEYFLEIRNK